MNNVYHPNEMELFKQSASKKTFNRCVHSFENDSEGSPSIENATVIKKGRGRKPAITQNSVQPFLCQYGSLKDIPVDVMYVIEGVARLDWYSRGDAMRKNVVAPDPIINHSFVRPWTRVYIKYDRNKEPVLDERFTKPKPNDFGEWFLSPAGQTRKDFLINLNKIDNNVTQLSVNTIVRILRELSEISTKEIEGLIGVNERQARRYNQACRIMVPFLERAFQSHFEFRVEMLRERYKKTCLQEEIEWTQEDEEYFLQGVFDSYAVDSVGGGLSDYYHEDICGVYVPFEGVKLESFKTTSNVPFEDFGIDDYLLAGDVQ